MDLQPYFPALEFVFLIGAAGLSVVGAISIGLFVIQRLRPDVRGQRELPIVDAAKLVALSQSPSESTNTEGTKQ